MNHPYFKPYIKQLIICFLFAQGIFAQGWIEPLTTQGLDHNTLQSAASRSMGGTTIGLQNEAGLMFSNPASLQSITGIQVSLCGLRQYEHSAQVQQYAPLKYYSNFSLLMEGLTGYISNPTGVVTNPNAGDTVQRPYDKIRPYWSRTKINALPIQALFAVPFMLGEKKFTVGAGFVEYANLDNYYRNNNLLFPSIGSERPVPFELPASDSAPFSTNWFSFYRSREGSIYGYGAAISGNLFENMSFGISDMILKGSTDDDEHVVARGTLIFYRNWFRLDSVYGHFNISGTSDYSGNELTFSGIYRGRYISAGFVIKPPTTITREYNTQIVVDTNGTPITANVTGQDKMTIPWRGTVGLSLLVRENVRIAFEYELRYYSSAVYEKDDGTQSNPWLSSSLLHAGVECTIFPWLQLRAGIRGQAEVFEPEGNPMIGDPVSYSVYSAGAGFTFAGARLNVTYEYAMMKYQDMWQTNVNLNSRKNHTIIADITYEIPWNEK